MRVGLVHNTVYNRVPESRVDVSIVYLSPKHGFTFLKFGVPHFVEKIQVFFHRSISVRGWGRIFSTFFHLFTRLVTDIRFTLLNKFNREVKKLIKVIRRVCYFPRLVAQPAYAILDTFNEIDIFFIRVCIIKS